MHPIREGRETLARMFYRRRRCGGSYQGLTQATQRVGPALFHHFWILLRGTIPKRVESARTWYDWTVFAVDGSRINAPRTRRNERALGKAARDWPHKKNERPPGPPKLRRLIGREKREIYGMLNNCTAGNT